MLFCRVEELKIRMRSRLESLSRAVGVPRSYFQGRTHAENCIPNNVLIFRRTTCSELRRATFEMRPHHRFVLIFNLATSGSVRIDRADVRLHPGDGLLILPYQFHAFAKTEKEEILWLIVTFECERPALLEQFRGKVFRFGASARRRMVSLLELYCSEVDEPVNQILAFELACLLLELQRLTKDLRASPTPADPQSRQLLDDIASYLHRSPPGSTSVKDVAKHLNISESRLRARFRATFGSSLGYHLRNFRLHLAIERMRDTRRNFTKLASELGFPDSASFSRFIRQQTGSTPTEFRHRMIK